MKRFTNPYHAKRALLARVRDFCITETHRIKACPCYVMSCHVMRRAALQIALEAISNEARATTSCRMMDGRWAVSTRWRDGVQAFDGWLVGTDPNGEPGKSQFSLRIKNANSDRVKLLAQKEWMNEDVEWHCNHGCHRPAWIWGRWQWTLRDGSFVLVRIRVHHWVHQWDRLKKN
jgi:hypothetical protein